jgi:hypothetical protein
MSWIVVIIIVIVLLLLIFVLVYVKIYPFTRYVGHSDGCNPSCDIKDGSSKQNSEDDCATACLNNPECNEYLYTTGPLLGGSNCWLKNAPKGTQMGDWSSGILGVKHTLNV